MMIWDFEKYSENIALKDEHGITVSYGELLKQAQRIKRVIGERCLIFCLCTNSIGSVSGYVSLLSEGMVPVLLNAHLEQGLLDNLINIYKPAFIWSPVEAADKLCKYGNECCFEKYDYSLLKTDFDGQFELHDELCLLLTTSGSTGSPKFVRQSYRNVASNAQSIAQYLELDETEKPITTLPMNYTYGLSIINSHLLVGATLLLTDKGLMQKEFWKFFKEEGATSFGGVPYTYEMLKKLRFFNMALPALRYMTQAGGKLLPKLHQEFAEYAAQRNKKFIVMYGQCEATARMGYLPAEKSIEKCGSMGIAIPGGRFHLTDANGTEINEPDVIGELIYEGDNVTLGYAECGNDLKKGDERNGVLETGDMAQFDADGYYYIVGRKKRFLKIYGNRVNLDEIDRLIKAEFDGIDVTSAGTDDHMYLFVTDEKLSDQVKNFVALKTGLHSGAFHMVTIDSIPKNDSGKILYQELAKYYE